MTKIEVTANPTYTHTIELDTEAAAALVAMLGSVSPADCDPEFAVVVDALYDNLVDYVGADPREAEPTVVDSSLSWRWA